MSAERDAPKPIVGIGSPNGRCFVDALAAAIQAAEAAVRARSNGEVSLTVEQFIA